jgi:cyclohexadieny/prephenate dehydrogenase
MNAPAKDSGGPLFERVALIGVGLIGSSLALAMRRSNLAGHITGCVRSQASRDAIGRLGLLDSLQMSAAECVTGADLVILCTPVGTYGKLAEEIGPHLAPGCVVTDVGSVKQAVVARVSPHIPANVHFIPGHPVAGTEYSGPEAGFAELFDGRWTILTPLAGTDPTAVERLTLFWEGCGARVEMMDAQHHDRTLAITSHLPHLIAYTIVGTAADLEKGVQKEVVRYSAGGFRDFTRIAGSDPIMWRDIFLSNREAVLEMLQRFSEDLTALQRAIRWGEGQVLEDLFRRTRAVRQQIVEAHQAGTFDAREPEMLAGSADGGFLTEGAESGRQAADPGKPDPGAG